VITGMGEGATMPVESTATPSTGKLTGSLVEVIKESASLALSWVKTHSYGLGLRASVCRTPADAGRDDRRAFLSSCGLSEEVRAQCRLRHGLRDGIALGGQNAFRPLRQ